METLGSWNWEDLIFGLYQDPEKRDFLVEVIEQNPKLGELLENIPYQNIEQVFEAVGNWNRQQGVDRKGFSDIFTFKPEFQSTDNKIAHFWIKIYQNGVINISISTY
ncbi:MAG: hypothetical protein R3B71_02520 [Candidatus Gracilibacteria bacterium]